MGVFYLLLSVAALVIFFISELVRRSSRLQGANIRVVTHVITPLFITVYFLLALFVIGYPPLRSHATLLFSVILACGVLCRLLYLTYRYRCSPAPRPEHGAGTLGGRPR